MVEATGEPLVFIDRDRILVRDVSPVRAETTVLDRNGDTLLTVNAVIAGTDIPGDGAFLDDDEARITIERSGDPPRDRLALVYDETTTPLSLVDCAACTVDALAVRAINGSLIVAWHTTDSEPLELARLAKDGTVLSRRAVSAPDPALAAIYRFRREPLSDRALILAKDERGFDTLVLLDSELGVLRSLPPNAIFSWTEASLLTAVGDSRGDLFVSRDDAKPVRYTRSFYPTHATLSPDGGSAIIGLADERTYFVRIDSTGAKVGGDLVVREKRTGPMILGALTTGALVALDDRRFAWFYVGDAGIERAEISCRR